MLNDLRYAFRTLRKAPGFTAIALIALALGIGANTAIFALINALLIRPLPYVGADQLVELSETQRNPWLPVDYLDYLDWKRQNQVFEDMAFSASLPATIVANGVAERVQAGFASGNFFSVLGVAPAYGRSLRMTDDEPGAARIALLSHEFWHSRMGADPAAVGRSIQIDGSPYTVAGVLPAWFRYHRTAQVWATAGGVRERYGMSERGNHNNGYVIARLKPGVTLRTAGAQMETIARRLASEYPATNTGIGVALRPLRELLAGGMRNTVFVLLGAVGLVLLIACVNVANLLLARSATRRREIALRAALGADRAVIARQLLTESLLLAGAGSALGLLLSLAGIRLLGTLLPRGFDISDLRIDFAVLGFTAAVACFTGLLFGVAPALQASKVDLADAMRSAGKSPGHAVRGRFRNVLIVAEVAFSIVLLTGAGLLIESFWRLTHVDAGLRTANVVTLEVPWPYAEISSLSRMGPFYGRVLERIGTLPGVEAAGGIWVAPLSGSSAVIPIYRSDRPLPERGKFQQGLYHAATPGYFKAAGIPLVRGRIFTEQVGVMRPINDLKELRANWSAALYKAVVSETMARRYWPGEDPIGKRFRFGTPEIGGPWLEITGVVGDVRHYGLHRQPEPEFYFSADQEPRDLTLFVRSGSDAGSIATAVRSIIREIDPNVPAGNVRTLEQVVDSTLESRRTNMLLLASLAALALVLAAVGIYGVISYAVASRTQEFGIRMALGATRGGILRSVLGQSAALALVGCGLGLALALALSRFLTALLFGISPVIPSIYAGVAALVIVVALLAAAIPARRATQVDPMVALRQD